MFYAYVNKILRTWLKWENKAWHCRIHLIHKAFWYKINKNEKCWKCDFCIWEQIDYPENNKIYF